MTMNPLTNTQAVLPELPYPVRQIVRHWIVRGVPAGVAAVVTNERLYLALKADLPTEQSSK